MLIEIYCEEFYQKKIELKNGLNVVLGSDLAHNSIGKSTFLLLVDYAFGGKQYAKSLDIHENIGEHDIFFTFKFNDKLYKFSRKNNNINDIWECDESYNKQKQINLEEYCNWLATKYDLILPELSFRNAVSRYIRVYGKNNHDENRPLNSNPNENGQKSSDAVLKLFNMFATIKDMQEQAKLAENNLKIYKKAQSLNYIENITTKDEFNKNIKQINKINTEINKFANDLEKGLLDVDSMTTDEVINLKILLSKTRRAKGKIKANYNMIDENGNYEFSSTNNNFEDLKKYFPSIDVVPLAKIENFHNRIAEIFNAELSIQREQLKNELENYDRLINTYEEKLKSLITNPNLSKFVLSKYATLLKERESLEKSNNTYKKLSKLKSDKKTISEQLKELKAKQLVNVQNQINIKMTDLNDYIYTGKCNAPILSFTDKNYIFHTPNDTGTGVACKGLVVYDLSILALTKLPMLAHDSIILKQISDEAIEKILELYISSGKQIFISLDKQSSYTPKAIKLLNENAILKLLPNGQELFGKSWG